LRRREEKLTRKEEIKIGGKLAFNEEDKQIIRQQKQKKRE